MRKNRKKFQETFSHPLGTKRFENFEDKESETEFADLTFSSDPPNSSTVITRYSKTDGWKFTSIF